MSPTVDARYPIGKFEMPSVVTDEMRRKWVDEIAAAPARLRAAVESLTLEQIDTPYREGGWTVRQVVHHLPDSHMNSYIRMKLALTEDRPTIKPYDESRWAELDEARTAPVEISLALLESLHRRWVLMLRALEPADFSRVFVHPEIGAVTLDKTIALYAWHGRHHVGHIELVRAGRAAGR